MWVISGFRTFTVTVVSDVADLVVTAHHGEGLCDRFVARLRRHVELVRGAVQVVDNDGAGFGNHNAIYHIRCLFALRLGSKHLSSTEEIRGCMARA